MAPGGIGGALALIAAGAILRYATTWELSGVDLRLVGLILMVVGVLMLVLTFVLAWGSGPRPPGARPPGP